MLMAGLKTGGLVLVGFFAEKLLSGVIRDQVLARIIGKPAAAPPAAAGLDALQPYAGLISSAVATGGGLFVANKVIKDTNTKHLVMAGMGAGFLQTLVMFALDKFNQPTIAAMLSGDATAARIAAMYGVGASIMPHYAPAAGVGEYFQGTGEYFSGLGSYGANPDLYQAAAGMGAQESSYGYGNHVSPSSDLDRELSIAEAAAGVGSLPAYEASAGVGEYFQSGTSGLGATVPSSSTWVPGSSNAPLWAGVRSVSAPQSAHAMLPAGVLETGGGSGIFG